MTPKTIARLAFEMECDGLLSCLATACQLCAGEQLGDEFAKPYLRNIPYYGDPVGLAVWQAKHVMRQARRLNLYPQTSQLEQECRRAA